MFRVKTLTFNNGKTQVLSQLNVIVGPNDSGKSATLRDIERILTNQTSSGVIVSGLTFERPSTAEQLREQYGLAPYVDPNGSVIVTGLNAGLTGAVNMQFGQTSDKQLNERFRIDSTFLHTYGQLLIARLGTEERLTSAKRGSGGGLPGDGTLLQAFYRAGPEIESEVASEIRRVFGAEIRLDYSTMAQLAVRVGDERLREIPVDPRLARPILQDYPLLDDQGDGIRSFTTILIALRVLRRPLYLIDEPEAFLHPPQAYRLGRFLATASRGCQLIIASHSTDFLRGVLDSAETPIILRMERDGSTNAVSPIEPNQLNDIIHDPLLQSARVLDGLFYEGIVITEADADRTFYATVAAKMTADSGIHFTSAQGKHTIERIASAYRTIGIPVASIIDIDILNDAGDFKRLMEAHGVPETKRGDFENARSRLSRVVQPSDPVETLNTWKSRLNAAWATQDTSQQAPPEKLSNMERLMGQLRREANPWNRIKDQGVDGFGEASNDAKALLDLLTGYGIFVVPVGELEGWLKKYDLPKQRWISTALTVIRDATVDRNRPPWNFMVRVLTYLGVTL